MKIVTVVGARPQFIKAAVVSRELRKRNHEILIHTGQHFDYNMSEQFFEELDIAKPDYNLGISGGTHGEMTGRMMIEIEKILKECSKADLVLLYGDTNSTIAAALAAAKLHIHVCHVEAGTRTHCRSNPEEINRICTDHVSDLLLTSTQKGVQNLLKEGLHGKFVGDPMLDAFIQYSGLKEIGSVMLETLNGKYIHVPDKFYYLTCHREENAEDYKLTEILEAMEQLSSPVIYPVHPRNISRVENLVCMHGYKNIITVKPVGYLDSICLINYSEKVITDSGGLQREAFFAKKQCVTILDFIVWQETMVSGRNQICKAESRDILEKLSVSQKIEEDYQPFGDGHSAVYIVQEIENHIGRMQ